MKLNILYFGPCGLFEGIGGAARLRNMLNVLGQLQANTQLISYLPEKKFNLAPKRISYYVNTVTIYVPRSLPKILKAPALLLILLYGLRYIIKSNVVFAHSPSVVYGFPALILAKIFGRPLLIDHMDIRDHDTPGFIYNSVLKNSDIVFAISRFLEEEVKELGCRNVVYVPVFIDADVFQKDALERVNIRKRLDIEDKEIVIGYAGSFSHIEGLPFLLKAFKKLSNKYENIKLVMIGGRNVAGEDNIAQLIDALVLNARVILIPPQPYELMPKYLSAFDIACSPKIDCAENRAANPIKIYEYMSMGLPMVVSAVGETSNVIENGYDGFLVKPGDEDDLERTLEYVIQNLDSSRETGKRAREKIIKNYSQEVMLKRIENALKQLVSKTIWTGG